MPVMATFPRHGIGVSRRLTAAIRPVYCSVAQPASCQLGTRFIEIKLDMFRYAGSYNDGYADNLSLVLWQSKVFLPLIMR